MLSFLSNHPPRTKVAQLNKIHFDDGRSSVEFKPPSDDYLVINRWPPAQAPRETVPGQAKCALSPPLHWHYYQKETFHILSGTGNFMLDGEQVLLKAGEIVDIPPGVFHTFCNASMTEEMVVEFTLAPSTKDRDERFFRNLQSYRDDMRKAGIRPSLPQLLLFMRSADVILAIPGPKFIAKPLGVILNFLGGLVIGRWLLGYSECYPEYSHSRSR